MTPEEFISLIKIAIESGANEAVIENLQEPLGRKPDSELVKNSEWFISQDKEGKERIESIISDTVSETVFGFLSVLDGVRSISEAGKTNSLELHHIENGHKILLNDQSKQYLHDIYKSA